MNPPEENVAEEAEKEEKIAEEQQDILDKPFESRKMYLDSLTEYGAAEYLTRSWRTDTEFVEAMQSAEAMHAWMKEEVDDRGRKIW